MTDLPPVPATPQPSSRWYHSVGFVLLMLFVVLGPLGLPLLWKSRRFSRTAKIALTVVVVAFTVWLLGASVHFVTQMLNELQTIPRF